MSSVEDRDSGIASGINNAITRAAGLIIIALLGLFGASHAYRFSITLSSCLAIAAGIMSFVVIRTPEHLVSVHETNRPHDPHGHTA